MVHALAFLALSAGAHATAPPAAQTAAVVTGFLFTSVRVAEYDYKYVVYVPREFSRSRKWPAIVFLHGAGECGVEGLRQVSQGLGTAILANPAKWPFVVVMPQKPEVRQAWEDHDKAVLAMLDAAIAAYSIDPDRVYLTGLSQGGHGTWAIAARHPDRWAAIAPICGYGDPAQLAGPLKSMPIWCFHGEADTAVPVAQSVGMIEALKALGASPKYTSYPGVGHNSWDKAYRDEPLAAWFLEHVRAAKKP
jgi:predicted peptidase